MDIFLAACTPSRIDLGFIGASRPISWSLLTTSLKPLDNISRNNSQADPQMVHLMETHQLVGEQSVAVAGDGGWYSGGAVGRGNVPALEQLGAERGALDLRFPPISGGVDSTLPRDAEVDAVLESAQVSKWASVYPIQVCIGVSKCVLVYLSVRRCIQVCVGVSRCALVGGMGGEGLDSCRYVVREGSSGEIGGTRG